MLSIGKFRKSNQKYLGVLMWDYNGLFVTMMLDTFLAKALSRAISEPVSENWKGIQMNVISEKNYNT